MKRKRKKQKNKIQKENKKENRKIMLNILQMVNVLNKEKSTRVKLEK